MGERINARRRQRLCPFCSRSFTKEEHLDRHIRTHTRERPFVCDVCHKCFSRRDTLLRHSRSHHLDTGSPTPASVCRTQHEESSHLPHSYHDPQELVSPSARRYEAILPRRQSDVPPMPEAQSDLPVQTEDYGNSFSHNQAQPGFLPSQPSQWPSPEMPPHSSLSTATLMQNIWDTELMRPTPGWLASDDFDLHALNVALISSSDNNSYNHWSSLDHDFNTIHEEQNDLNGLDMASKPINKEDSVHMEWFTYTTRILPKSGQVTPDVTLETRVDEVYRRDLMQKLQPKISAPPLPSTDFLNLCIQMYFTKFQPIFPVIHAPTFHPSPKSSLLLLSICSVGSLFVGSSYASSQGRKIFEGLHKAIISSWEMFLSRGGREALSMIQAALIGQTFALLSGQPKDLCTAHSFHGTVISWAKRHKMFHCKQSYLKVSPHEIATDLEKAWRSWIENEEMIRIVAGIYIHDVEISELFHSEPFLKHTTDKLPHVSNDSMWVAKDASTWYKMYVGNSTSHITTPASEELNIASPDSFNPLREGLFRQYIEIQSISARVIEQSDLQQRETFVLTLTNFYDSHLRAKVDERRDFFCLPIIWHSIFMSIFTDFDRLELAIGKEGHAASTGHADYAQTWAGSVHGQRSALHAYLILKELGKITLGAEPPIHVPRIVFRAAVVWYLYTRLDHDPTEPPSENSEFPEFRHMGIDIQMLRFEANGFKLSRPSALESSTFCGLASALQRLGHRGISRKFAYILALLLPEATEDASDLA